MPLKSTFGEVKAKIEADTGMPPGKQKLQCESIFVKGTYSPLAMDNMADDPKSPDSQLFFSDSNSLAFYNIKPSSLVLMTLKERGGRKK